MILVGQGCAAANSSPDNAIKAVFTTGEISEYLGDVAQLEETVGRDAAVAEAQCIIQPYHDIEACNVDACSEPGGVREPSNAT